MTELIRVNNIARSFNKRQVINNFSCKIFSNNIYNIYGKNGSGKTTLCKLIANLIFPETGNIIKNRDVSVYLVSSNNRSFYHQLSVKNNLLFFASLMQLNSKAINIALDEYDANLHIKDLMAIKYINLSDGEKKRLSIFRGLIFSPNLLVLDEPFNFLDSDFKSLLVPIIQNYISESKSVIVTSNTQSPLDRIITHTININHNV